MNTNINAVKKILYIFLLCLLAAAIPLSRYVMSVTQFAIMALWLIEGMTFEQLAHKKFGLSFITVLLGEIFNSLAIQIKKFWFNKPAVIIASLYLLHIIGLLYTDDFQWALKDLRVKLPLLSIPVLLSGFPKLSKKEIYTIFSIHALAVLAGTIIITANYFNTQTVDIRELYTYISHIRFSLNVVLAIFAIGFIASNTDFYSKKIKYFAFAIVLWLTLFLFIFKALTGIVIFLAIAMTILLIGVFKIKRISLKVIALLALVSIPLLFTTNFIYSYNDYTKAEAIIISELDSYTELGNKYTHDTIHYGIEQGRYIGLYINKKELSNAWNKVSTIPIDGKDKKDQNIYYTIIRYLNSKNLRKDAAGVQQLSKQDIKNIENGIANYYYTLPFNLKSRTDQIIMGYLKYKQHNNANRNSIMQRIEYWRASWDIFTSHAIIGVGTGDMNLVFKEEYNSHNFNLHKNFQLRSHNQYMAIAIAFGIIGLIWFLISFIAPSIILSAYKNYLFVIHFSILFLSMLWEDTLETQAGVTFAIFFYSLLLFTQKHKEENKKSIIHEIN